MLSFANQLNII